MSRPLGALAATLALLTPALAPGAPPPPAPAIHIEDVAAFYRLYDAAGGHPTPETLQHDYLDAGSPGLRRLASLRKVTGPAIAEAIARRPEIYAGARRCMTVLPAARRRETAALRRLAQLYPQAQFPPITIAVGRGKPVGVTDETGVMIGLEALCAVTWLEPDPEARLTHVLAHEYAHAQQAIAAPAFYNKPNPTVLEASLIEGAAEFTAELISGSVSERWLQAANRGHELAIETAFAADEDSTDLSRWLYNGTLSQPGDNGYWVGYRIAKAYYRNARDKRRALAEILGMTDAKAFLARSGWRPGIALPD
ncbi:DUF2268 domain-containing putative Zn-dependent protease [Caulobacter sp. KR2-114]|uniref:DUF2268 domain-containing putative Zn-dependent protease n=1 Tax=Caulobacter sp. KR2-114 TaxID=3400912 RepID=UPI003C0B5EF3